MKDKILLLMMGGALLTTSCNDLNEQDYEGNSKLSQEEFLATNEAIPSRVDATYAGMFNYLGKGGVSGLSSGTRADDIGFVSAAISQDAEGADLACADNNYNWFSVADELTSRNASYANPRMRYQVPYMQMGVANQVISSFPENTTDSSAISRIAGARAIRAFDYLGLAPYFQFGYATAADQPCVPELSDSVDATNNPRATVRRIYEIIMSDLNYACEHLTSSRQDITYINRNVAYGLRARANLNMGNWAAAAADAEEAMKGYTPISREDVSVPAFCDASKSPNWIWGVLRTASDEQDNDGYGHYQSPSAWLSAFSGDGYAAATGNTPVINKLLWDKIPSTDVRKGWWLDGNKHSPNWASLTWTDPNGSASATGDDIADFVTSDGGKTAFQPYTNIKFGQKTGVGSTINTNDFPLMRVEEMILIEVEGLAKSGNESRAREILTNFVRTYRDPSYDINGRGLSLADEIWFQRRVELWGEGFFTNDAKRLGKPIVRFHNGEDNNFPTAYQFNISPDDGWLNMRFPQGELDNNQGIVNNTDGSLPVAGQNGTLRDGVTD